MMHRLREAMRSGGLLPPIGGEGKTVETDETYFGSIEPSQTTISGKGKRIGIRRPAKRAVLVLSSAADKRAPSISRKPIRTLFTRS